MKNLKRKLMLTSLVLCGSVALGFGLLNEKTAKVSANTLDGFEVASVSLRVPEGEYGEGIRYTVTVNAEDIKDGATTGVLMIPTSSLGANELSLALTHNDLRNYTLTEWKVDGDKKEAYVHLYDVPADQYATSVSMCAYIQNPDADPIYTAVKETSVAEVAVWAIENDSTLSEADKASLIASYLTYTVNYYDDDQSTLLNTTTGVYNKTLVEYIPEKDGYEFVGWFNKAGTHEWDFDTTTVGATTTNLYAKWLVDLSAASTGDWNIGETTFTGPAVIRNSDNKPYNKLYQIENDAVMMHIWNHSYAGFEATFKTPIDATSEDKYVSFTAKGADKDLFTVVEFDTSGTAKTGATKACVTRTGEDGFTTYVFRIAKGLTIGKFRVTPLGDTTSTGNGSEVIISNCTIGDYSSLRTGEDANTLFFMDVPLGTTLQQIYRKNQTNLYAAEYTTEIAYGNERGSYKSTVKSDQAESYHNITWYDADKNFLADTDYVVFYLYSTYSKRIFFSMNRMYTATGYELMPNAWNRIVISGAEFKSATWTLIDMREHYQSSSGYFDLYMSKVVRYTAEEVAKLENMGTTDTWMVGSTTFVGTPTIVNGPTSTNYLAGVEHKKAYLVGGELSVTFVRHADAYITLTLAESITVEANTEMYVTVVMYDYGRLDKLNGYFNSSGLYAFSYVSHEDVGNGYAKVTFKCSAKSSAYTITSVRLDVEDHLSGDGVYLATQFRIKDIVVSKQQA